MDNVPGFTIFQGAGSIQLNTSAQQRLEEEEALEDQRRHHAELDNRLQNAFDDLIDDNTMVSSVHDDSSPPNNYYQNNNHVAKNNNIIQRNSQDSPSPPLHRNNLKLEQEVNHLRNALDSKTREAQFISDQCKSYEMQINDLKKKLSVSDAEKERAIMSRKQTHELLVKCKEENSELESNVQHLKSKIEQLEAAKTELISELDNKKTLLSDAQQKYLMIEKNAFVQADRQAELMIKQTNSRYSGQIDMMQQQINGLRSQLDDKNSELKTLDARFKQLQQSREAMLVEKSETINQLSKQIQDSQRHCQLLVSQGNLSTENVTLKTQISALQQQTRDLQKTIANLTQKLETSEMKNMDSTLNQTTPQLTNHKQLLYGSTPIVPTNTNHQQLKHQNPHHIKSLEEQLQAKNAEIKRLKDDENNALVKMMSYKAEATRLKSELNMLKNEMDAARQQSGFADEFTKLQHAYEKLSNEHGKCLGLIKEQAAERICLDERCKDLSMENESLRKEVNGPVDLSESKMETIKMELEKQKFLLNDAHGELDRIKKLYMQVSGTKDQLARQLNEIQSSDVHKELYVQKERVASLERAVQLSEMKCCELKKLLEREKVKNEMELSEAKKKSEEDKINSSSKDVKNASNSCSKCIDNITEHTKYEIENLQLQNACVNYLKEINDLKTAIADYQHTIKDLQQKIIIKDEHDQLITELKQKAIQFEEYINKQQIANATATKETNTDSATTPPNMHNKSVSATSPPPPLSSDKSINNQSPQFSSTTSSSAECDEKMAKILAAKIKSTETMFQGQIKEIEENLSKLNKELAETQFNLKIRDREVQVLKQAILSERQKMHEIIAKKDFDCKAVIEKQNYALQKCRNDLEATQKRCTFLTDELNDRREQFESELASMKCLMQQWSDEKRTMQMTEEQLRERIHNFEMEKLEIIQELNGKYHSAKKTAANYKKYAEDKDKHIAQENERIKLAYENAIKKMKDNMESIIKQKDKQVSEKLARLNEGDAAGSLHMLSKTKLFK